MTKTTVATRNFANTPKKKNSAPFTRKLILRTKTVPYTFKCLNKRGARSSDTATALYGMMEEGM